MAVDQAGTEPKPRVLPQHRVPAHLARRLNQICVGVMAELLLAEHLNPPLYGVLAAIQDEPGSSQTFLARRLGVDAVSLCQMTDELEERKLVERRIDPDDRRARKLYVTRRGGSLRERLRPELLAAQERLLSSLSKSERTVLLDLLVRVVEANDSYARPGNGRRKPRPARKQAKEDQR
jgi:MarR family transcriptional regulator, temperature-dependent positive regulator of motility